MVALALALSHFLLDISLRALNHFLYVFVNFQV